MPSRYFVFVLTDIHNGTLWTGVTADLARRLRELRAETDGRPTPRRKLVYYEVTDGIRSALRSERTIKETPRRSRQRLIDRFNPEWRDLAPDVLFCAGADAVSRPALLAA